jgi:hypothetical protein
VCDHASEVVKVKQLSAMMIEDTCDWIAECKSRSESQVEVLGRLLSSEEKVKTVLISRKHIIYIQN